MDVLSIGRSPADAAKMASTRMPSKGASSVFDQDDLAETYAYLLGRALVVRQERMDAGAAGFAYNQITYNPLGSADFVNPNLDVAYLEAWIAVDDDTVVQLDVPRISDRYYTAQLIDEWGEVFVNIHDRSTPSAPFGSFALTKPGSAPTIAEGVHRISLHSAKAKLLARVELRDDPDEAVRLQHQFRLSTTGRVSVASRLTVPDFDNADLLGVEIFDHVDDLLTSALDVSPVAARRQLQARTVAASIADDPAVRRNADAVLRDTIIPELQQYALTRSAPYRNHWLGGGKVGNYGADDRLRTAANYIGIWANTTDEVAYFVASRDNKDEPLDGGRHYTIRFPADALPDSVVDSYWSVILVDVPGYRVVPNTLDRFNLNTYSDLVRADDGSLTIGIGPTPVDGVPESNWLPSAPGAEFSLTFRAYVPTTAITDGLWSPPAVTPS
jgi:hypothetical protein